MITFCHFFYKSGLLFKLKPILLNCRWNLNVRTSSALNNQIFLSSPFEMQAQIHPVLLPHHPFLSAQLTRCTVVTLTLVKFNDPPSLFLVRGAGVKRNVSTRTAVLRHLYWWINSFQWDCRWETSFRCGWNRKTAALFAHRGHPRAIRLVRPPLTCGCRHRERPLWSSNRW